MLKPDHHRPLCPFILQPSPSSLPSLTLHPSIYHYQPTSPPPLSPPLITCLPSSPTTITIFLCPSPPHTDPTTCRGPSPSSRKLLRYRLTTGTKRGAGRGLGVGEGGGGAAGAWGIRGRGLGAALSVWGAESWCCHRSLRCAGYTGQVWQRVKN